MRIWGRICICLILPIFLSSCISSSPLLPSSSVPDKLTLEPTSFRAIAGWEADNHSEALVAFLKSCTAFNRASDETANGHGILLAPMSIWKSICRQASLVPLSDAMLAREFFEQTFVPFQASGNHHPAGFFTGYYVPMLAGAHELRRPYIYPVYGLPEGGVPPYPRKEIDEGILKGEAPVLAFVDDPVRLYFMHVQGSGYIRMEDGTILHLSFAGKNGLPYVSIGKILVERGMMKKEDVNLARLRQWLYDHPGQMWSIMWENPSYIFFRATEGDTVGTQEAPLTAGRSLAVDAHYIPLGMPVFINTLMPATSQSPMSIYRRLMIAQDTGAAIVGPLRVDVFFGSGLNAEALAGNMKEGGTVTVLIPRALAAMVGR